VIYRIEAGVGAIDRPKEWQQMNAAEKPSQWPVKQRLELAKPAAREAIDVSDELDLVLHGRRGGDAFTDGAPFSPG